MTGNDTDPDGNDTLTVLSVEQPARGSVSLTGTGVRFDPGTDFDSLAVGESEDVTFTYTVINQDGATATQTITVTVTGTNDAPTAVNDTGTVNEDATLTRTIATGVISNDIDPDTGEALSVTTIRTGSEAGAGTAGTVGTALVGTYGTLTLQSNGSYSYTANRPAADALNVGDTGTDRFTYTVSDGKGGTDTAELVLTVNVLNDPTVTAPDAVTINPVFVGRTSGEETTANTMRAGTVNIGVTGTNITKGSDAVFNAINAWSNPSLGGQPSYQLSFKGGTGSVTFTFSAAVTNPILHIDRLGGISGTNNTSVWTLATSGASLTSLGGTDDFLVSGNSFQEDLTGGTDTQSESTIGRTPGTASGSVRVNGTFTTLTFNLSTAGPSGADEIEIAFEVPHHQYNPQSVNVLANDVDPDNSLSVVGLSAPTRGSVSHDGTNVTFTPGTAFGFLNNGQSAQEVITYTLNTGATGTVTFTVNGSSTPALPPIVIDLDGDGVEFTSIEDGILLDVDGDGELEQTAWAGRDDAVLIYDGNGNNRIDGPEEFSFARYADHEHATDLDGLRHFDSDGDLMLTANDSEFAAFKLWRDADGDGLVGDGELFSLTEAGIESIGLVSDGRSYFAADGDVTVHGESQVRFTDGTTSSAADASFDYREIVEAAGADQSLAVITEDGITLNLDQAAAAPAATGDQDQSAPVEMTAPAPAPTFDEETVTPPPAPAPPIEDDLAAATASAGGL